MSKNKNVSTKNVSNNTDNVTNELIDRTLTEMLTTKHKTVLNTTPFAVMQITTPDNQIFQKRFRQNHCAQFAVLIQRPTKQWATLRGCSSEKSTVSQYNETVSLFIDQNSPLFRESRYIDIMIVKCEFIREMSFDSEPLSADVTENRTWAREIRKMRKIALTSAVCLPFLYAINTLTACDILPFLS